MHNSLSAMDITIFHCCPFVGVLIPFGALLGLLGLLMKICMSKRRGLMYAYNVIEFNVFLKVNSHNLLLYC